MNLSKKKRKTNNSVIDNGIGIEDQYHDHIFEPFKTLQSKSKHDSAGLGLAIVKKIIQQLGGTIEVHSTLDKGSAFTIFFTI